MSKILKNTTASAIFISDTGVTLDPSPAEYTIPPTDYLLWAASSDIITNVGSGDVIVNDGSSDLSISDGTDLIKGIFPAKFKIVGATDGTLIGNVGDKLKTDSQVTVTSIEEDYRVFLLDNNYIYSAAFLVNAVSSSLDNPIILFKNPSGSGKKIYFLQASGNTTISNERSLFRVSSNPTISINGTLTTPQSRNIGNSAPASSALVYSLPTITTINNPFSNIQTGENTNSQDFVDMQQLCMQPNNSILITAQPKSNNRIQAVTIVWSEQPL